jgi:hypothetical protein
VIALRPFAIEAKIPADCQPRQLAVEAKNATKLMLRFCPKGRIGIVGIRQLSPASNLPKRARHCRRGWLLAAHAAPTGAAEVSRERLSDRPARTSHPPPIHLRLHPRGWEWLCRVIEFVPRSTAQGHSSFELSPSQTLAANCQFAENLVARKV